MLYILYDKLEDLYAGERVRVTRGRRQGCRPIHASPPPLKISVPPAHLSRNETADQLIFSSACPSGTMGKSKDWEYFVEAKPLRPGQPATRPYLDVFSKDGQRPLFYAKDLTKNLLSLCYNCTEFIEEHPTERADVALRLGDKVHANQGTVAQKSEYEKLKTARARRLREGHGRDGESGGAGGEGEGVVGPSSVGTALSRSVWLHGLGAAERSSMLSYVQRASEEDKVTSRKLLAVAAPSRWARARRLTRWHAVCARTSVTRLTEAGELPASCQSAASLSAPRPIRYTYSYMLYMLYIAIRRRAYGISSHSCSAGLQDRHSYNFFRVDRL